MVPGLALCSKLQIPATSVAEMTQNMDIVLRTMASSSVIPKISLLRAQDIAEGVREPTMSLLGLLSRRFLTNIVSSTLIQAEAERLEAASGIPYDGRVFDFQHQLRQALWRWCAAVCAPFKLAINDLSSSFADGRAFCFLLASYRSDLLSVAAVWSPHPDEDELLAEIPTETSTASITSNLVAMVFNMRTPVFSPRVDGIKKNFALIRDAVKKLGGVPLLVSSTDFHEGSPEESLSLFLAYLSARLLASPSTASCKVPGPISASGKDEATFEIAVNPGTPDFQIRPAFIHPEDLEDPEPEEQQVERLLEDGPPRKRVARLPASVEEASRRQTAASIITRAFRSWMLMTRFRRALVSLKEKEKREAAALRLQTILRSHQQRTAFKKLREAAIKMQSFVRRNQAMRQLFELQEAARQTQYFRTLSGYVAREAAAAGASATRTVAVATIAQAWRAHHTRVSVRAALDRRTSAAVAIQAAWRGFVVRQRVAALERAALAVQSRFRSRQAQQILATLRSERAAQLSNRALFSVAASQAAQVAGERIARAEAQAVWNVCGTQAANIGLFYNVALAATLVQQRWRAIRAGRVARTEYVKLREAAIKMQSFVRRNQAMRQLFALKTAAVEAQQIMRSRTTHSLAALQTASLAADRIRRLAAARIRSSWLSFSQRRSFEALKSAARVLQERRRATATGRMARQAFLKKRKAVICVQAAVRRYSQRKRFLAVKRAAITLQKHIRGQFARRKFQQLQAERKSRLVRAPRSGAPDAVLPHSFGIRGARSSSSRRIGNPDSRSRHDCAGMAGGGTASC
eukprot:TRINITY_DN684_c0_g1_i6.p1 TRINITY_DN684_c0_g1~~TRINITY_DN684_c0_g1_i6.p1  ORF type:complete len:923 (+),score=141.92 TRINITY_DN684_c0_g1_i6:357-2771(+)